MRAPAAVKWGKPEKAPSTAGWGRPIGHWEGETLVVDVTGFNEQHLVRPGRGFSQRHVARGGTLYLAHRRYHDLRSHHRRSHSVHAALEDQFAALPPSEKNARLLEFRCVEFAEEVIYGPYYKNPIVVNK